MPNKIDIYHNPRCSKSRQTLALLEEKGQAEEKGLDINIILYLESTPSADEIKGLLSKLGISPRELLRKGEDAYKELNLKDKDKTDAQLIDAMAKYPKLIERPIVVNKNKAVLGRPPENVLTII